MKVAGEVRAQHTGVTFQTKEIDEKKHGTIRLKQVVPCSWNTENVLRDLS